MLLALLLGAPAPAGSKRARANQNADGADGPGPKRKRESEGEGESAPSRVQPPRAAAKKLRTTGPAGDPVLRKGGRCLVRWADDEWHPATVTSVHATSGPDDVPLYDVM